MDMLCPKCGEPFENDLFHEIAADRGTTYREVIREFQTKGCKALSGEFMSEMLCASDFRPASAYAASALYDLLGDDTDGAMSMLEDLGF